MDDLPDPDDPSVIDLLAEAQKRGIVTSFRMRGDVITIVYQGLTLHFDRQHALEFVTQVLSNPDDDW